MHVRTSSLRVTLVFRNTYNYADDLPISTHNDGDVDVDQDQAAVTKLAAPVATTTQAAPAGLEPL